jgi:hypothetical protein
MMVAFSWPEMLARQIDRSMRSARSSSELYDPATNAFRTTGSMVTGRARAAAVTLPDGKVLVAGGDPTYADSAYGTTGPMRAELYDPATGVFSSVGGEGLRGNVVAVALSGGRVLIFGKNQDRSDLGRLWDPASGTLRAGPEVPMALWNAVAVDDGRILLVGAQGSSGALATYDPGTGKFEMLATTAGFAPTPARLRDGRILLIGGLEDDQVHHPELGGLLAPGIDALEIFE